MRFVLPLLLAAQAVSSVTLKFMFTAVRNDNPLEDVSLSELDVYDAVGNALAVASISGHHNAYHPSGREEPAALIDGDNMTKWVDLNFTVNGDESYLIVELSDGQPFSTG